MESTSPRLARSKFNMVRCALKPVLKVLLLLLLLILLLLLLMHHLILILIGSHSYSSSQALEDTVLTRKKLTKICSLVDVLGSLRCWSTSHVYSKFLTPTHHCSTPPPLVQSLVKVFFNGKMLCNGINADEAVVICCCAGTFEVRYDLNWNFGELKFIHANLTFLRSFICWNSKSLPLGIFLTANADRRAVSFTLVE